MKRKAEGGSPPPAKQPNLSSTPVGPPPPKAPRRPVKVSLGFPLTYDLVDHVQNKKLTY